MGFIRAAIVGAALLAGVSGVVLAGNAEGLIKLESEHDAPRTVERFQRIAESKGLTVFETVDHANGARSVDMSLRPTTVVIFGNPKAGTPLMQCAQTVGLDLPMKALVWTDASGQTWLGYNDPAYIAARHDAADCQAVDSVSRALRTLARAVVADERQS